MPNKKRYFYDDVLDEHARQTMARARRIEDLDEDIALARTELHDVLSEVNHDHSDAFKALGVLKDLHLARFRTAGVPNPGIEEDAAVIARIFANPLPLDGESLTDVAQPPSAVRGAAVGPLHLDAHPRHPEPVEGEGETFH